MRTDHEDDPGFIFAWPDDRRCGADVRVAIMGQALEDLTKIFNQCRTRTLSR